MMRSLWISKTGMEAQQTQLDTISNNLANVSTNGYKRSHAVFEDLMYQNLRQAGAATSDQTQLPTGLQVANTTVGGTCLNATTAGVVTVAAGGPTVTVANLQIAAGASSCTVTVTVTNVPGQANLSCTNNPLAFTNGSANVAVTNVTNGVTPSCVVVNGAAISARISFTMGLADHPSRGSLQCASS